jgi:hypothetical protein
MFIKLIIYFGELVKVALKKGLQEKGWMGRLRGMGVLSFVTLVCFGVCFYCCSRGCLCQRLQGAGVVCSWYGRLISIW